MQSKLLLDPWSPDYEAPIQTGGADVAATGELTRLLKCPTGKQSGLALVSQSGGSVSWTAYVASKLAS